MWEDELGEQMCGVVCVYGRMHRKCGPAHKKKHLIKSSGYDTLALRSPPLFIFMTLLLR